jgi:hypothetical protein
MKDSYIKAYEEDKKSQLLRDITLSLFAFMIGVMSGIILTLIWK